MNQTTWNKTTKKKFLAEAKRHRNADRFLQGQWIEEGKDQKGMQCYSCPMCEQKIYWSRITQSWVDVSAKQTKD